MPAVCTKVKAGKGRLTKLGELEKILPVQVQLSTAGYILGKYLVNVHFLKEAAPEACGQRFAAQLLSTQGGHGAPGSGVAAGGKYLSWEELLGTGLCFLVQEPWCQRASQILLHRSCGQEHCCPTPGRNKLQNINLCFCKSLEGAPTLECAHQVFKEAGDNAVSWRRTSVTPFWCMEPHCSPAQEKSFALLECHRSVAVCNKMGQTTFLWSKVCVLFLVCHDMLLWCITASWVLYVVISLQFPLQMASPAPLCTCLLSN